MQIDPNTKNRLNTFLTEHLKPARLEHTMRVCTLAKELAAKLGADEEAAELAALFHDAYRNLELHAMNEAIDRLGIPARYKDHPNLAHSKIAAAAMEQCWNIQDPDILHAVSFHTTGRAGMSLLEKIIFIADAAEPGRDYPGVAAIREALFEDIDRACLLSLEGTIRYLQARGEAIDPDTLCARDDLEGKP